MCQNADLSRREANLHIKKRLDTKQDDRSSLWGADLVLVRKLSGVFRKVANISTTFMERDALLVALSRFVPNRRKRYHNKTHEKKDSST